MIIYSFLIGLFIGGVYFGGLYYTTATFHQTKHFALVIILSFVIRLSILGIALYYLAQLGLENILIGFLGIMLVRTVMVSQVKKAESQLKRE